MITEPDPTSEQVAHKAKSLRLYGILYAVFAVFFLVIGVHSILTTMSAWYGYIDVGSAVVWLCFAWRNLRQASGT